MYITLNDWNKTFKYGGQFFDVKSTTYGLEVKTEISKEYFDYQKKVDFFVEELKNATIEINNEIFYESYNIDVNEEEEGSTITALFEKFEPKDELDELEEQKEEENE